MALTKIERRERIKMHSLESQRSYFAQRLHSLA